MKILKNLRNHWLLAASAVFIFIAISAIIAGKAQNAGQPAENKTASAKLVSVNQYLGQNTVNLGTGTVESLAQADLRVQYPAQITAVNATLGQNVSAGQILITLKNDDIAAQLKQAQAGLDAALSRLEETKKGSRPEDLAISQTNAKQAQTAAQNAALAAYTTADDATHNHIDKFFANPRSENARFGVIISSGTNFAVFGGDQFAQQDINREKYEIEKMLALWQKNTENLDNLNLLDANLELAKNNLNRLAEFCNKMAVLVNQMITTDGNYKLTLDGYKTELSAARSAISASQQAVVGAQTNMEIAKQTLALKQAGATAEQISQAKANADLAQAAVDLVKANMEKTFIRSPISGKVSFILARVGEMATSGQLAASVVNTDVLLVKTFGAQEDMPYVAKDSLAIINNGAAQGIVQTIAPSVNPQTRKFQADILVVNNPGNSIIAGQIVQVDVLAKNKKDQLTYLLPIESVLFLSDSSYVLTADNEGLISQIPITTGQLIGEKIQITGGLAKDLKIIDSVRGFKAGDIIKTREQE